MQVHVCADGGSAVFACTCNLIRGGVLICLGSVGARAAEYWPSDTWPSLHAATHVTDARRRSLSLSLCTSIYIHIYICICICISLYIYTYIYIYMRSSLASTYNCMRGCVLTWVGRFEARAPMSIAVTSHGPHYAQLHRMSHARLEAQCHDCAYGADAIFAFTCSRLRACVLACLGSFGVHAAAYCANVT